MKLVWSPLAVRRTEETAAYLARESPVAARRWTEGVFRSVVRLKRFPRSGRVVPEVGRREIREIFFGSYRVIYRVAENRVGILTVRHQKRLFDRGEVP